MTVPQVKARLVRFWLQTGKPFLVIILVMTALRSAIADWNDVPSGSMRPTLVEGDRILVNKLAYDLKVPYTTWHLAQWSNPKRGDIVVFYSPHDGTRLVKRVIGLPGDRIEMKNEELTVNGVRAQYGPLPSEISADLPPEDRASALFATESITNSRDHAVMVIPSRLARRNFETLTVPADSYFMMGDNRDNSFDSRFFGPVPRKQIVGQAKSIVLSFDRSRYFLPRWQRFFSSLK